MAMTTTLARSTDPETSKAAAKSISATTLSQKDKLLLAFVKKSMTAEQAAENVGLLHVGYWKRVSDLANLGYITPRTQKTAPKSGPITRTTVWNSGLPHAAYMMTTLTRSGKYAIVWQITPKGREAARQIKASINASVSN